MKFSIITPSYNQGAFIERTLNSILSQEGDFDLELRVMDAGSSDGTLAVLRHYEGDTRLRWTSGPDQGQSDAINRGFEETDGDVIAWLNSDDMYEPGALQTVAEAYNAKPFDWCFGNCRNIDEHDHEVRRVIMRYKREQSLRYSYARLLRRDFVSQPATFFTRKAYQQIGDVDRALYYSMDYDYWLRLGRASQPTFIDRTLASFRWHSQSKNGALYRRAAWETYQTARRHAQPAERIDLLYHFAHVMILSVLYPFL